MAHDDDDDDDDNEDDEYTVTDSTHWTRFLCSLKSSSHH